MSTFYEIIIIIISLDYFRADDAVVKLSGTIVPLVTLRQPLSINLKTEYFNKGIWNPGMLNFAHFDICEEIKRNDRSWSSLYDPFKKCPPTTNVSIYKLLTESHQLY